MVHNLVFRSRETAFERENNNMLTAIKPKSRQITDAERTEDGVVFRSEFEMLRVQVKTPEIVRITATPCEHFSKKERPGTVCDRVSDEYSIGEDCGEYILTTNAVTVYVDKASGAIRFNDPDGREMLRENRHAARTYEEFETYTLAGTEQKTRIIDTADGKKEVLEQPLKIPTGKSFHIRLLLELGDEALYGFGQHEQTMGSLRNKTLYLHQANRQIAVPMVVSTKGYGILFDAYCPMIFREDESGAVVYLEADRELDYYVMVGGMNRVIRNYRVLTGKAVMLPKWAFGYIQSQERYETQEEILRTAAKSRELGIGMDCIVLDWISWGENQWGQKSYDEKRFPAPKEMIGTLHNEHVRFMISLWPTMAAQTEDHREFAEQGLFLPASDIYNAFRKEARELYWKQLERKHFAYGTDAWWCDSSEPITPEWNHVERPEPSRLYEEYCSEAGLRLPYEYCNAFPLYHAMGIYENQRECMNRKKATAADYREKRVCNLTRSAYTGQQRYGTIMWSGDTAASWETLRAQVTAGLHFCASGLPYWTMDIGAFFVKSGVQWYWDGRYDNTAEDKAYCELFVRWYQLGCFLPVFRGHGTDCRRELWNFKGEFYDALIKANRLRYQLIPYIYSEAGKVWLDDASMIRWLAFDHSDDREVWNITDQYLFGDSLMICPVLQPMYYGEDGTRIENPVTTRQVYFPKGCDWYDLYTGRRYPGGSHAVVSAALDEIPVFVKAGSVIPMCEAAMSTDELGEVTFRAYGDGECRYRYYTDAGDGYGYENGEYTVREITENKTV